MVLKSTLWCVIRKQVTASANTCRINWESARTRWTCSVKTTKTSSFRNKGLRSSSSRLRSSWTPPLMILELQVKCTQLGVSHPLANVTVTSWIASKSQFLHLQGRRSLVQLTRPLPSKLILWSHPRALPSVRSTTRTVSIHSRPSI